MVRRVQAGHRARGDRGAAQSLQWTLLAPVVVLATIGLVQSAIVLDARQTARTAALAGAEAEALFRAPVGSGRPVATSVAQTGGLRNVTVTVSRTNGMAVVTVTGSADTFLDVGQGNITRTATIPLEEP